MLAGKASLVLNAISITRDGREQRDADLATRSGSPRRRKGPARRMGLEHVMTCYVIWKFAENIDGAKKFLVDLDRQLPARRSRRSEYYNFPCFPKQVPDLKETLRQRHEGQARRQVRACSPTR